MKHVMLHHELHREDTSLAGKLIRSMREVVFGVEDGIVSTLGAITGIAGGTGDPFIVVLAGLVIIFVESLSMAAGTYLSSKSEREMEEKMLREEAQEIEDDPEGEREELVQFYASRGFTPSEVGILVKRITSDKKLWLEEMAFRELKLIPQKKETPKTAALFMAISYILGGCTPLIAYFLLPIENAIVVSVAVSVCALFLVGYIKGRVVQINRLRSGIEMAVVSLSAAGVGYVVGQLASRWISL
jgi:predicted membrane protein (TIGR00267 family)